MALVMVDDGNGLTALRDRFLADMSSSTFAKPFRAIVGIETGDARDYRSLADQIGELVPKVKEAGAEDSRCAQLLDDLENRYRAWQVAWDEFSDVRAQLVKAPLDTAEFIVRFGM